MNCVGINCGAGTFLLGAQKYFDVLNHYSHQTLGQKTCLSVNCLPSAQTENDYTRIPYHPVDAVFANSEDWLSASNAVKYGIAHRVPIIILDVRSGLWQQYETFFKELAETVFPEGYRVAYVFYHVLSFDGGFRESRLAYVVHQKKHNFNISAPSLPSQTTNIWEYLKDTIYRELKEITCRDSEYDRSSHYSVEYEENLCLSKIEKGWALTWTADKRLHTLPGGAWDFVKEAMNNAEYCDILRLQWNLKLISSNYKKIRYCHPDFNRLLTIGEMMKIVGWNRLPAGTYPMEQMMYGTPADIGEWLALQAKQWLENKWGKNDWAVRYDPKKQKFVGGKANPLRPKKFIDISRYYNELYNTSDVVKFAKLRQRSILDFEEDLIEF